MVTNAKMMSMNADGTSVYFMHTWGSISVTRPRAAARIELVPDNFFPSAHGWFSSRETVGEIEWKWSRSKARENG